MTTDSQGLAWQVGVWDQISQIYRDEIDPRFEPVVEGLLRRAGLRVGERVLDLGTGTGAVAAKAAALVADEGLVLAVDISPETLDRARRRSEGGSARFQVREAAAEAIPAGENAFDVILAALSLMYVIDRAVAARELARVLRPGGRLVGAVWSGPESCDIVLFQQTAGRFAPTPPVSGVAPARSQTPNRSSTSLLVTASGSGRDRGTRIRLRRLRQRVGRTGRRHDRAAATGTTRRSQNRCARGDVAGPRCRATFPQHRPVHRRTMSRTDSR